MNSEMDKPMYLEDEKQPQDNAYKLYEQFLELNELEQDIFFGLFIRRQTKHQSLERDIRAIEIKSKEKEWSEND